MADGGSRKMVEEIIRLEGQVEVLGGELKVKEEEYITALEARDKESTVRLEDEIRELTDKRDSFRHVAEKRKEEHRVCAKGMLNLYTVIYASSFTKPMTITDIACITSNAARRNASLGVTGVLLFSIPAQKFLQVLEGRKETLNNLYPRIESDTRHTQVLTIRKHPLDARRFPDWYMHPIDLNEVDAPEQPLQTVVSLAVQQGFLATQCLHSSMRDILTKGGNPLYIQPKRLKAVVLMASITDFADFACLPIPATDVSDLLATFTDVVTRCALEAGGTVIKTDSNLVQAQWLHTELKEAKQAMLAVIGTFAKLRAVSTFSVNPDDAEPEQPLLHYMYPVVALSLGAAVIVKHSTDCEVRMDVVGPAVTECEAALRAGLEHRVQAVISPGLVNTLAFANQYRVRDIGKGYAILSPEETPDNLGDLIRSTARDMVRAKDIERVNPVQDMEAEDADMYVQKEEATELVMPSHPHPAVPLHPPLPPPPPSDRVLLADADLKTQFEALDTTCSGLIAGETFLEYYAGFDAMGIVDTCDKIKKELAGKDIITYDEFCIYMLRIAQD